MEALERPCRFSGVGKIAYIRATGLLSLSSSIMHGDLALCTNGCFVLDALQVVYLLPIPVACSELSELR